jgi:SSS family solute:Na+ symporter
MINAGAVVLNDIFGLPPVLSVLLVAIVTTPYTTFGGLRASVITDAFHHALFAILLPVVLLTAIFFHIEGDAATFFKNASAATINGFKSTPPLEIISLVGAFLLGETLIPPYANLALASKTIKVSRNSFILAGIFSTVWFAVMVSLGIVARGIIPLNTAEDHVLLKLVKATMPNVGYALLLVALISIVLSSLDSLLNAGAVVFTEDIVKRFAGLPDKAALIVGRSSTIIIAAIAAATAVFVPSIIKGLLICYTIWAPAILPAAIFGLWLKKPQPLAGILSMSVGTLVAIMLELAPRFAGNQFIYFPTIKVPAIIPALGAAIMAYLLGHLIESIYSSWRSAKP